MTREHLTSVAKRLIEIRRRGHPFACGSAGIYVETCIEAGVVDGDTITPRQGYEDEFFSVLELLLDSSFLTVVGSPSESIG